MIRIGRFTSAAVLIALGVALLMDQLTEDHISRWMIQGWPLIIIGLGLEYIAAGILTRKNGRKAKVDIWGITLTVIISVAVIGIHAGKIYIDWGDGDRVRLEAVRLPLSSELETLQIDHRQGDIEVRTGNVETLQVEMTMVIPKQVNDKTKQRVLRSAKVETEGKRTLTMRITSDTYRLLWFEQKPKVHLKLTIPNDAVLNYEVSTINGDLIVSQLQTADQLVASTTNGDIQLDQVKGSVTADTTNGEIHVNHVDGNVRIDSTNGDLSASNVTGDVDASTENGELSFIDIAGKLNGRTVNGDIDAESIAGGAWHLENTNGDITLGLPAQGHYRVEGTTGRGDITVSGISLQAAQGRVQGKIGEGTHLIELDTNGDIAIHALTNFQK